jgi:hypothetical protein
MMVGAAIAELSSSASTLKSPYSHDDYYIAHVNHTSFKAREFVYTKVLWGVRGFFFAS